MVVVPAELARDPPAERRSLAFDVVALLHEDEVRRGLADDLQRLLRSSVDVVGAV